MGKLKKIISGAFIKNVALVATGTALAQIITMLLSPIITRVYGPEAYGIMGAFSSILHIITPIAALTYPIAIVLPKSDSDAHGLARLSLNITTVVSILVAIVFIFFGKYIASMFNIEEVAPYLFLLPVAIFLSGLLQIIEQWLIRTKQFRTTAKSTFLQSIIVQGGKAGIGLIHPTAGVLIFLSAISEGVKAALMFIFNKKTGPKLQLKSKDRKTLKSLAQTYKDFPIFRAPETFLNSFSTNLPTLMLTTFFGPAAAGFYNIGKTVLNLPSQLIGKSVGDVFYPRASEAANNHERLTPLINKATLLLAAIGIVPYGLVILFGPWLFSFVFGQEWEMAGHYARWIALWSFFGFINRPSVRSLPVLSAQQFQLIYTIVMLIVRILALGAGYYIFKSDLIAIALFGISGALLNIGLIFITNIISRKFDKNNLMNVKEQFPTTERK